MSDGKKIALVTGASRGIGRAIAELLLSHGRRVLAVARDSVVLDELAAAHPGSVVPLPQDLMAPWAVEALCQRALSLVPAIDELVCAAGMIRYAPVGQVTEADLRAQFELNVVSPFLLAQRVAAHMRERTGGSVVFVASTLGERAARLTSAYAASKAALIQTARAFALELAPSVRVSVVSPGIVDTDMVRVPRQGGEPSAEALDVQMKELTALHPLGRLGTAEEVAEAVLFSLEARWLTGSVLTLDGGISLV